MAWEWQWNLHMQGGRLSNRLFYLSIPPNIFIDAVRCASMSASSANGWTRVIVEKPFGRDSESSAALTKALKQYLEEDQIFRWSSLNFNWLLLFWKYKSYSDLMDICFQDRPLSGKRAGWKPLCSPLLQSYFWALVVKAVYKKCTVNILWRFWHRRTWRVSCSLKLSCRLQAISGAYDWFSSLLVKTRYFDNYGIIRDIMQNHLLQILALFAMETPVSLDAEDIRNEKVLLIAWNPTFLVAILWNL